MAATRWVVAVVLTLLVCLALAGKDYYKILGLKQSATTDEIKKAYRKLARDMHPDRHPDDPSASQKFQELAQAYETLSDDEKRQKYDRYGEEGLSQQHQQQHHDPFADFFGGGQAGAKKAPSINVDVPVTLKDLYVGSTIQYEATRQVICPTCRGSGAAGHEHMKKCSTCKGQGVRIVAHQLAPNFVQHFQQTCDVCGGTGKVITKKCPLCHGNKVSTGSEELELVIERGMPDGHAITFANKGEQPKDLDIRPGDVIFHLRTQKHEMFTRDKDNLKMTLEISLKEALLGFSKTISHLDGHDVVISSKKVTQPNDVIIVKGEGMPHHNFPSDTGDLLVTIKVKLPSPLTEEQRKAAETF